VFAELNLEEVVERAREFLERNIPEGMKRTLELIKVEQYEKKWLITFSSGSGMYTITIDQSGMIVDYKRK